MSGPFEEDYAEHPILPQRIVLVHPGDCDRIVYSTAYGQAQAERGVSRAVDRFGTFARIRAIHSDEYAPRSESIGRTLADIRALPTAGDHLPNH